jgi:hypothetical protein
MIPASEWVIIPVYLDLMAILISARDVNSGQTDVGR